MNVQADVPGAASGPGDVMRVKALPWIGGVALLLLELLITAVLLAHDGLLVGDGWSHAWSLGHRPPAALSVARAVTATGTSIWPYLVVLAAGLWSGATPRARAVRASAALTVLLAGQGIRLVAMQLIARSRPPRPDWATHASGFSMPSGHTTTTALAAGLVCWAVTRTTRRFLARCVRVLVVVWASCVALTRVYLGVHWASDILAGWLLALAYLSFLLPVVAALERRSASHAVQAVMRTGAP
ncbi:phosphatase PAP2 family protein [Streptomyces sp. BH106]|uniref:phosphatase PAP2 family protein n=1 Tax=Streptomyces sp. BH106 TaxID=3410409 RepID=UPI003CED1DF2